MAGTILRLVPVKTYNWTNYGNASTNTIVLADYIDLSGWKEGMLLGRAHAGTNLGTGANAQVNLYGMDPASDDPAMMFATATQIGAATMTFDTAVNPPGSGAYKLIVQPLIANFGLMGRLLMTMAQGTGGTSANLVMSIDLVLKTDG